MANDAPSAEQAIRQRAEEALRQQTDRALEEDASLSREAIRDALVCEDDAVLLFEQRAVTNANRGIFVFAIKRDGVIGKCIEESLRA